MRAPTEPNPYAAPVDEHEPASLAAAPADYRQQGRRVSVIAALLSVYAATTLGSMWSCLAANGLVPAVFSWLEPYEVGEPSMPGQALMLQPLALASGLAYLACVIAIGAFFVRANHNARALDPNHGMTTSPGWTVGWFFIPFANLFRPYQAVKEIWAVSEPFRSGPLPAWWTFWIIMSAGGRLIDRASQGAETMDEIVRSNWMSFGHGVVALAAATAVFLVVRGLHSNQQRHAAGRAPAA